jgi:hypothetical protein
MLLARSAAGRPALAPSPAAAARPARPARVPAAPFAAPQLRRASTIVAAAAQGASTVRVNVQGRHLEVTDALKAYAVSEGCCGGGVGGGRGVNVKCRRVFLRVTPATKRAAFYSRAGRAGSCKRRAVCTSCACTTVILTQRGGERPCRGWESGGRAALVHEARPSDMEGRRNGHATLLRFCAEKCRPLDPRPRLHPARGGWVRRPASWVSCTLKERRQVAALSLVRTRRKKRAPHARALSRPRASQSPFRPTPLTTPPLSLSPIHHLHPRQEEKVSHALHNFEGAVKSADVKLSVAGGDAGKGAKAQKTEVTIYTLRHGVVRF